jgi:hypothetical protein
MTVPATTPKRAAAKTRAAPADDPAKTVKNLTKPLWLPQLLRQPFFVQIAKKMNEFSCKQNEIFVAYCA